MFYGQKDFKAAHVIRKVRGKKTVFVIPNIRSVPSCNLTYGLFLLKRNNLEKILPKLTK